MWSLQLVDLSSTSSTSVRCVGVRRGKTAKKLWVFLLKVQSTTRGEKRFLLHLLYLTNDRSVCNLVLSAVKLELCFAKLK